VVTYSIINEPDLAKLVACPECDLLLEKKPLHAGEVSKCPRCRCVIMSRKKDSVDRTIAVSIAGLISFFPAIYLPLLGLEAAGLRNEASLIECILTILNSKLYFVAVLVILFCLIVPFLRLSIALYLMILVKRDQASRYGLKLFRHFLEWEEWGMLEVFMLGMIVSLYKILGLADAIFGYGFFAFSMLLLSATLVSAFVDEQLVWEHLSNDR